MVDEPTPAATLDRFGRALFGEEWGAPMARLTSTEVRTTQRVRAAVLEGRDYPAARGVLAALYEKLTEMRSELAPFARKERNGQ